MSNDLAKAPKARLMPAPWILGIALVAMGLYIAILGFFMGGDYIGHSLQTPGTIVQLQGDRPVVSYVVGGTTFQHALGDHGPEFQVGQTITMCFSEANPAGAQSCSDRTMFVYWAASGLGVTVVGLALALWALIRRSAVTRVIRLGNVVDAKILKARVNKKYHIGKKVLWYITCVWDDPGSVRQLSFVSQAVWAVKDPTGLLFASGIETLPVYIDPSHPGRNYYVDTRALDRLGSSTI